MIIRFSLDAARRMFTPVDNRFILDFLPHASDVCIRVYLYGLMLCSMGSTSEADLGDALGLSETAVKEAYVYWQNQGLVHIRGEEPLIVEYLDLEPTKEGGVIPGKYASLVSALNSLIAPRQFDFRELVHVYDWIEVYGLDEGAVLELVSHCMDIKNRRVSVNYIDSVARTWSEDGIKSREQARAYIDRYELKKHGATLVLKQWNKQRKPTQDEMFLYEKWVGEWGFTPEAILAALPKLTVTGSPNFTYLDELLDSLRREGQTSAPEMARADAKAVEETTFARLVFERAGKVEPATRTQKAQISMYLNDLRLPRELMLFGAEQCRGANEPFGMMKKLWSEWHEKKITTIEEASKSLEEKGKESRKYRPHEKPLKLQYPQHTFTDEQLAHLLVDLDKDIE
ncbi:MAG TPA: DnaD domain protein [Candidatus Cryosericum sp.]|nr:DnaD domain protein [Candidatus Cryosericum sp.]